jgi:hypothetical protein
MTKQERLELDMQRAFASSCKQQQKMTKVLNLLHVEKGSAQPFSLVVKVRKTRYKIFNAGKFKDFGNIILLQSCECGCLKSSLRAVKE